MPWEQQQHRVASQTLQLAKAWCVSAHLYNRKALHLAWPDRPVFERVRHDVVEDMKDMPSPDFETVLPDSMLDELGAAARPSDFKPADAPEARAFLGAPLVVPAAVGVPVLAPPPALVDPAGASEEEDLFGD